MRQFAMVMILTLLTIVSCAKEKDKKSQTFSADPLHASTLDGYFNPNSQTPIEVGGVVYTLSSQSNTQLIYQALQQAQQSQIQPLYVNGVAKYRAKITGYVNNIQYAQTNQYNNQQYNNQYTQTQANVLTLVGIQFY